MRFLLIPVFLYLLILIIPFNIEIQYCRKGQDDNFELKIFALVNFFAFSIKIPFLENYFFKNISKLFAEIDIIFMNFFLAKKEIELEQEINLQNIKVEQLKKLFSLLKQRKLASIFLSSINIRCTSLEWHTEFGFSNPALTGISNGFLWMLKGIILELTNPIINYKKDPAIKLTPSFNQEKFYTSFYGIFSFRIGNIILTILKVLIHKIKGGSRLWQNIQLKN
ncbi:DUF2953 domain-containing protein [Natronospora cellulosivora (SeqCode)]